MGSGRGGWKSVCSWTFTSCRVQPSLSPRRGPQSSWRCRPAPLHEQRTLCCFALSHKTYFHFVWARFLAGAVVGGKRGLPWGTALQGESRITREMRLSAPPRTVAGRELTPCSVVQRDSERGVHVLTCTQKTLHPVGSPGQLAYLTQSPLGTLRMSRPTRIGEVAFPLKKNTSFFNPKDKFIQRPGNGILLRMSRSLRRAHGPGRTGFYTTAARGSLRRFLGGFQRPPELLGLLLLLRH